MTQILGMSTVALVASLWVGTAAAQAPTPTDQAPAATDQAPPTEMKPPMKKPMHHKMSGEKMAMKTPGDAAVEDLNDKSLAAAKGGMAFTPPPAAPMEKPMAKHMKSMKMMKKAPEASDSTSK